MEKYRDDEIQVRSNTYTWGSYEAHRRQHPGTFADCFDNSSRQTEQKFEDAAAVLPFPLPEEINEYLKNQVTPEITLALVLLFLMKEGDCRSAKESDKNSPFPVWMEMFYGPRIDSNIQTLRFRVCIQLIVHWLLYSVSGMKELLLKVFPAVLSATPDEFWSLPIRRKDKLYWAMGEFPIIFWFQCFAVLPYTPESFQCHLALLDYYHHAVESPPVAPDDPRIVTDDSSKKFEKEPIKPQFCNTDAGVYFPVAKFFTAFDSGLLDENSLYRSLFLFVAIFSRKFLRDNEKHPLILKAKQRLIDIELARVDLQTVATKYVTGMPYVEGAANLVRTLAALGKYNLVRCYYFGKESREDVFSRMVSVCRPGPDDNMETLRAALKTWPVRDELLTATAMYTPAWADIIGQYFKTKDFSRAVWYFLAHTSDYCEKDKAAQIARYTPLTPEELQDGAFDMDWFKLAYETVGAKMFDKLYAAAKYCSGGANHRRAQIFADAALGRLTPKDVEAAISGKRNKEYVLALGILPGKEADFLHRYELLQQFVKESKQFGNQRQASEKRAVEIALDNMARTAGFHDVNRFRWYLESQRLERYQQFFKPHEIGDITVRLQIDESGSPSLSIEKKGKPLKSVPSAIRKDDWITELNEAVKRLRDWQTQARHSLEEAMESESTFEYGEVTGLAAHPVLGPLVQPLLWKQNGEIAFFNELSDTQSSLKIAHPWDLLNSGKWSEYQRIAVENQQVQPFKQIFRELYTLSPDEKKNGNESRRYEGYQIQARQGIALLKTRGWTVDPDEGLQKIHYKSNIIARVYAMADWFSPSEMEPPTLETVCFEDRLTGKTIPMEKLPPVLFSEVMRDVDLLVSIAHAGGVDPEASHSTIEMRSALVGALLPFFKLSNVRLQGSHAHIQGTFGNYSVHLGSGVCHQAAGEMINILPVHLQKRGRLFLPLMDDDPKTAEIITKILFLAEDVKIQDPNILNQINTRKVQS